MEVKRPQEGEMMWYNNPDAVRVVLDEMRRERSSRTKGLRLVNGHRPAEAPLR